MTRRRTTALAIIPARGGSKRIPRKNIRLMSGKPLIAWSIEVAIRSGVFDQVVVSTDDSEIADIATTSGATVPFTRPNAISDDQTPTVPVIAHAVNELRMQGSEFDQVCCIYPAAIFVSPSDYIRSQALLTQSQRPGFVTAIVRYPHPVERALSLHDDGTVDFVEPGHAQTRTQDLPDRWHDAGQFYWGSSDAWSSPQSLFQNTVGYPLRSSQVVDIDTEEDWELAELLHSVHLQQPDQQRLGLAEIGPAPRIPE